MDKKHHELRERHLLDVLICIIVATFWQVCYGAVHFILISPASAFAIFGKECGAMSLVRSTSIALRIFAEFRMLDRETGSFGCA